MIASSMRRPTLALIDQASVSGANFFLNAVLVRALDASAYGCFATAFVCSLFVAVLHTGAILDPMSIVAPARPDGPSARYVGAQLKQHVRLTSALALLPVSVGVVAWIGFTNHMLGAAFVAAGVTLPVVLLLSFVRRVLVITRRHGLAACAAVLYALVICGGHFVLAELVTTTVVSGYLLMTAGSLVGSLTILLAYRGRALREAVTAAESGLADSTQFEQARALAPAAALTFAMSQVQILALAVLFGPAHAGVYRAMQLPTVALGQVITAAATLALPRLSASYAKGDYGGLKRRTEQLQFGLMAICLGAELCLILAYEHISRLLFGNQFADSAWLMPVLGLVAVTSCSGAAFGTALRAMQRSRSQLTAIAITACIGVPAALTLTMVYGVAGAAASAVANYLALSVINRRYFTGTFRIQRRSHVPVSPAPALSPQGLSGVNR